jgi:hypothetical protein
MTEQNETINTEKTYSMSCPQICKRYPHAIFVGSLLIALILWIVIGSCFSGGRGHGGFERGMKDGRFGWQERRFDGEWKFGDINRPKEQNIPQRQEVKKNTSTGTQMTSPNSSATSTWIQK